jgi:branched-chain amino acid transport system substrate-binding protein
MSSRTKPRRLITAVAATVTVVTLIAGCGGSRVSSSNASADTATQVGGTSAAAEPGSTDAGSAAATDTGAGTIGSSGTVAAPAPAPVAGATTTDAAGTGAAPATGGAAATGSKGGAATTTAKAVKGASTTAAKAGTTPVVSKAVTGGAAAELAKQPIFGGSAAACKPATGTPINIGNVSTLSGVLGELFSPVVPAMQIFVASQNACGGLNGHPIKLFVADDQGDPATAVTVGRKMISQNKILAFVGNIQVLTIDGMSSVIKDTGIPIIGGDLTNNTWFTNPLLFPQGSPPQAISYGYHQAANDIFHKKNVGDVYCLEVPQACTQINKAFEELAPDFGDKVVYTQQISITSPDYTPQCIAAKNAGVEVMMITNDAPTQSRWGNSCAKVGYHPDYVMYPLGVGNEHQFLGNATLGNAYVPMNHFPWMAGTGQFPGNPAMVYYQHAVAKYNPGYNAGGAASLGWAAGALLVAASSQIDNNPSTAEFLNALYEFKGQKYTTLGGLAPPLTFNKAGTPQVPYCLFGAQSNDKNTGWARVDATMKCTDKLAPSDPQLKNKGH